MRSLTLPKKKEKKPSSSIANLKAMKKILSTNISYTSMISIL